MDKQNKIPPQLRNSAFRFIKARPDKRPFEYEWQTKNNYAHDDAILQQWNAKNHMYGIVCGYGNLIGLDFDCADTQAKLFPKLPKTFCVKSAGKGLLHVYLKCSDTTSFKITRKGERNPKTNRAKDITLIDIQGKGKQLIAPGSYNPSTGRYYEIVHDNPIAEITPIELRNILRPYLAVQETQKRDEKANKDDQRLLDEIRHKNPLPEVMREHGYDTSRVPTECHLHASTGKQSFSYNEINGTWVWHCFGCGCSGDVFTFVQKHQNCDFPTAKKILAKRAQVLLPSFKIKTKQEKPESIEEKAQGFRENALNFHESNPFMFDEAGLFWMWDDSDKKYNIVDEVGILNKYEQDLDMIGLTYATGIRRMVLNSLRGVGRERKPKKAKDCWVQFKEKIYDLESKDIFDASPEYFFVNPIPWSLGDSEETPIMDKLITEWVGKDYLLTAQEIMAYTVIPYYPLALISCLVGRGSNGKSVYTNLIQKFIGKKNTCSATLEAMQARFGSAELFKKLACFLGETNFGTMRNTALLKRLTGDDDVTFEFKRKNSFSEKNYAKIIISTNGLPTSLDTSDGFYRRWLFVEFPNQFKTTPNLLDRIPDHEYENFARKCLRLLPQLLERGRFDKQGNLQQQRQAYIMNSNPFEFFVATACNVQEDLYVPYTHLYQAYVAYLKSHHKRIVKYKEFNEAIREMNFIKEKTTKEWGGELKSRHWVIGLELADNWERTFKNEK